MTDTDLECADQEELSLVGSGVVCLLAHVARQHPVKAQWRRAPPDVAMMPGHGRVNSGPGPWLNCK